MKRNSFVTEETLITVSRRARGEQKYLFALFGDGIGIFFGQFSEIFEILKTKNILKISGFKKSFLKKIQKFSGKLLQNFFIEKKV